MSQSQRSEIPASTFFFLSFFSFLPLCIVFLPDSFLFLFPPLCPLVIVASQGRFSTSLSPSSPSLSFSVFPLSFTRNQTHKGEPAEKKKKKMRSAVWVALSSYFGSLSRSLSLSLSHTLSSAPVTVMEMPVHIRNFAIVIDDVLDMVERESPTSSVGEQILSSARQVVSNELKVLPSPPLLLLLLLLLLSPWSLSLCSGRIHHLLYGRLFLFFSFFFLFFFFFFFFPWKPGGSSRKNIQFQI